jgi:hypothetical protein
VAGIGGDVITFTIPGTPLDAQEIWLPVVGYESLYEVSSLGRIRSLDRKVQRKDGHWQSYPSRILSQNKGSHGYLGVALCNGGVKGKTRTVHSIVAEAFLGPRPEGFEVMHIDGDRANPKLSNLKYGTGAENQADRFFHGTHSRGEKNPSAKMTREQVVLARQMRANGARLAEIAKIFGVSARTVSDAVKGKTWGWL